MFCPSCGTEYAIELKYCNRCGANLGSSLTPQPEPVVINVTRPALIIGATLLFITLGGFAGLIGGVINLAPILKGNDSYMAIIMFGMMTIMIVDIFLVRLLSKLINASLTSSTQPRPKQMNVQAPPVPQFQPSNAARIQAAPSVTENTTRFFESYQGPRETEEPLPLKRS